MSRVTTQFEFHLKGADAPEGELSADHLIAIVQSLKNIALSIGRTETDAERLGRAPMRVHRVATLVIGLAPGSTTIMARRAGAGPDALDFDLADERGFDRSFERLIEAIALDERPHWVNDSLSAVTGELAAALQRAAPEVEFKSDGKSRRNFITSELDLGTWVVAGQEANEPVNFVGQLFAVNLNTHRLLVQDDVGHQVALPNVTDEIELGSLLGRHVTVVGTPTRDSRGTLTQIRDATIAPAPDPLNGSGVPAAVSLDDILGSAPGPDPDSGIDLTDEEFDSFLDAVRR